MEINIKIFQERYTLSNKDMARICQCSLPTIQKWRSGEVSPAGSARQLMRFLDYTAEGDAGRLRQTLASMNHWVGSPATRGDPDLGKIENSMTEVVDRLELMLEGRRKERELAESEARYRSMVESSEDPVCRWLPDTTLTYVNHAYADLFSDFGENLIGRKWIDFVPEEKQMSVLAIVSDITRRGEPDSSMHESVDKSGTIRYFEWKDLPIHNASGEVVELHSMGRDMTELVQLRREVQELSRVRNGLMSLCDHPVLVFDAEGSYVDGNAHFQERILEGRELERLENLIPDLGTARLKRLLKRITGSGQLSYRTRLVGRPMVMQVRLLRESETNSHYLALFEEEVPDVSESPECTNLAEDWILDGKSFAFLPDSQERKAFEERVEVLGATHQVDRIYVFSIDHAGGRFDNLLEWCASGLEEDSPELRRLPINEFGWWINRLMKGQTIQVDDASRMPRTATPIQQALKAHGIRSILSIPVRLNDQIVGFVSFAQTGHIRIWHGQEIRALEQLRGMLQGALKPVVCACPPAC
jgi:PAS domain S-box-containing protein